MRLRTLPLAVSSVGTGSFLSYFQGKHSIAIFFFLCLTTIFLQVLSNLANDYGDAGNGADNKWRAGPERAVQSGKISSSGMLRAIVIFSMLSFASGIYLLHITIGLFTSEFYVFLVLGLLSIVAAITYTMGVRPYGYAGLGDISVLIFFGFLGVGGSYYLQAQNFSEVVIMPALSIGLFSVAVLNVNNIRDIESDRKAGKISIPVRIGRKAAEIYHLVLLISGMLLTIFFTITYLKSYYQLIFVLSFPLFIYNGVALIRADREGKSIDPLLKQLALSTFVFSVLFCLGLVLAMK